ncbi:ABC transporter periplasmic substrate-binding protein [Azorhizobium caulinodans ORS 571]|uniref:ABC transporter periplasmic substrate-binding protein n=1 Tax=Azorhizobium caulinodans (strain ATCC 43989 / DSM 5975 / JCM 20966 / LMG 6465 / NBRC 14845 / NCIMB 13405 / ORS 571) TaxID=438753 RepID=A8IHZ9_AZOC5|nr:extracellular solute-binding protein [Azorhizobium caulinodans]BAF89341.1 ABC transporter periplasmic substrate-binding protein [Azorhizobium caulinodans ORS 571]
MTFSNISRRTFVGGVAGAAGLAAFGGRAQAQLALPKSPITLNVVDVAGNLALTQKPIENYRKAKPNLVSKISFTKAPAPELPGKIKAQQEAGRVDIDIVLTGTDALAAGIDQKLWVEMLPAHASALPKLNDIYLEPAARMQTLASGQGVVVTYYPSGPLIEYMPTVKTPPTTAEELLAWTRENKNRFLYARPANSGPGRTWLMGLPYLLKDADPTDPIKGWDKTWAYLKALGENIEYYPSGTTPTMKELGEGSRDIIVSTTGWDINPRVLGIVPKEAKVGALKGFHWVADAHYVCVPKGLPDEKMAVILDLISFILQPQQQAYTYDEGYFYPGPAVKNVPLDLAPAESQAAIKEYGRPEYAALIADNPIELPLMPDKMVQAFRRWDEEIGAAKKK